MVCKDKITELQAKFQQVLVKLEAEEHLQSTHPSEVSKVVETPEQMTPNLLQERDEEEVKTPEMEVETENETEEFLTPDFNVYPPDFEYEQFLTPSEIEEYISPKKEPSEDSLVTEPIKLDNVGTQEKTELTQPELFADLEQTSVALNSEIGLI